MKKRILTAILLFFLMICLSSCADGSVSVSSERESENKVSSDTRSSESEEMSVEPEKISIGEIYTYQNSDASFCFQLFRRDEDDMNFRIYSLTTGMEPDYAAVYPCRTIENGGVITASYEDVFFKCDIVCDSSSVTVAVSDGEFELGGEYYRTETEKISHNPPHFPEYVPDERTEGFEMDATLAKAIRESEGFSEDVYLTKEYLSQIRSLDTGEENIVSLVGLEYLTALEDFYAMASSVRDIGVITQLKNLKSFALGMGYVTEIPDLSSLENLERLHLPQNLITDITPLTTAPNLREVGLSDNRITSIAPIKDNDTLTALTLANNPITDYCTVSDNECIRNALAYLDIDLDMCIEVENRAKEIVGELINDDMSDLEKEYAVYRYIIENMDYEIVGGLMKPVGYNGLILGKGVCLEYANSLALLGQHAGLNIYIASSDTHSWDMIELDGEYYHVDALWDEDTGFFPQFFNRGTDFMQNTPDHSHDVLRYPMSDDMSVLEYGHLLK